jgi:hypothetical protein
MPKNGAASSPARPRRFSGEVAKKKKWENKVIFRAQVVKGKIKLWG